MKDNLLHHLASPQICPHPATFYLQGMVRFSLLEILVSLLATLTFNMAEFATQPAPNAIIAHCLPFWLFFPGEGVLA